jgi:hypothetical protein
LGLAVIITNLFFSSWTLGLPHSYHLVNSGVTLDLRSKPDDDLFFFYRGSDLKYRQSHVTGLYKRSDFKLVGSKVDKI